METYWITKYALKQGILKVQGTVFGRVLEARVNGYSLYYHGEGKDWHRTFGNAVFRAKCMRNAKIKSLQKKIKQLSEMRFDEESVNTAQEG